MHLCSSISAVVLLVSSLGAAQSEVQVGRFLGRLRGISAAWVEQRPHLLKARLHAMKVEWEKTGVRDGLSPEVRAKADVMVVEAAASAGEAAAKEALRLHACLCPAMPVGPDRTLAEAEAGLLESWMLADKNGWGSMPEVSHSIRNLMDSAAANPGLVSLVNDNLQKFEAARSARDRSRLQLQVTLLLRLLEELTRVG